MAKKDLRKEQVGLLRFEKSLINQAKQKKMGRTIDKRAIAAAGAVALASGAAAAEKLGDPALTKHVDAIAQALAAPGATDQSWLVALAETVSVSHAAFQGAAEAGGFLLLTVGGGRPKIWPNGAVLSALGIG